MATVRSVGWNLGTLRELGGGVMDMRKAIANKATGKHWEFTHRMAYTASLPIVTGLMGGFINYMYTGQRPEGIDYWFPRTGHKDEFGRDERISIPSYMKDLYHLMEGAKDIATGPVELGPKDSPRRSYIHRLARSRTCFTIRISTTPRLPTPKIHS